MIGPKAALEFLAFLLLLIFGLALRHPGLLALAIPLGWHLVLGLSLAPANPEGSLAARRLIRPKRLYEGESVQVKVEIVNSGKNSLDLFLRDGPHPGLSVTSGEYQAAVLLRPGGSFSLSYEAKPKRGLYQLQTVTVEVRDPLGLAPHGLKLPCPAEILVLPRYEDLSHPEVSARRTLPMPGTVRARRGGAGLEFYGIREYRPGDQVRRMAWKAFARHGEPAIVEFEEERAAEVAIILDVRARAYWGYSPELFEYSVRAAAALSQYYLRQGHRVALLKYGAVLDWVFPGYGRKHGERILRELARAKLGESEVFAELSHLPTRLLPVGSLLIFVSPLIPGDEETLGKLVARGYRVLAILPEPTSAELGEIPEKEVAKEILSLERWVLLRRLRRSGVMLVVWDVRNPLAPLLRRLRAGLGIWR
ncbi:MAG: DUF58 domain-containing protein [Candidatus Bipolaricaulaceae bacterium]